VIESADTEQASVVFLGHGSFRMQIGSTPVPLSNELAIPARGSENQTERLYGSNLESAFEPELARAPAPPLPKTRLVGLGLTAFAIGILVTTIVDRGLLRTSSERNPDAQQTRPPPAPSAERTQELPPSSQPRSAGSAQPLITAAPATASAKPPVIPAIANPVRQAPVRTVPALRTRRPRPAGAPASLGAKPVPPAPAAKWVDPFAG